MNLLFIQGRMNGGFRILCVSVNYLFIQIIKQFCTLNFIKVSLMIISNIQSSHLRLRLSQHKLSRTKQFQYSTRGPVTADLLEWSTSRILYQMVSEHSVQIHSMCSLCAWPERIHVSFIKISEFLNLKSINLQLVKYTL